MNQYKFIYIILLATALSACGSAPKKPQHTKQVPQSSSQTGGGYYKDDGPGSDLSRVSTQDAVPRAEKINPRTNRSYTALGKKYTPMKTYQPYKKQGVASWYGKRYHGNKTANGEIYDMYQMSAAHTILPLPSYARVTNLSNQKSVIVRVNDRGPFLQGRIIDLSYAAAIKLGIVAQGSAKVEVEAIDTRSLGTQTSNHKTTPTKVTSSDYGTFVQAGAFKDAQNAENLLNTLKSKNLSEGVGTKNWYNKGTYRVHLGPYSDRNSAEQAVKRIKETLGISAIIINR